MGLQSKMLTGWVIGFEEEAGVMRNAMTTRAPGSAKKRVKQDDFSLCVKTSYQTLTSEHLLQ